MNNINGSGYLRTMYSRSYRNNPAVNARKSFKYVKSSIEDRMNSTRSSDTVSESSENISTKDMDMGDYKKYISDKIDSFPLHPSLFGDTVSISISNAGYKAMKEDPDYEKWVLEQAKGLKSAPYPSAAGSVYSSRYVICRFGESKEDTQCVSWSADNRNNTAKSLLEKNSGKSEAELIREKRKKLKKRLDKEADERRYFERRLQQTAASRRIAYSDFINSPDGTEHKTAKYENAYNLAVSLDVQSLFDMLL